MPVDDRVDPISNARVHYCLDLVYFMRGITLIGAGQDGDANDSAFPVPGKVVDGAGIEELRPLWSPAIQRHSMQRRGIAVLINDLVSFDAELAMLLDEGLFGRQGRRQRDAGTRQGSHSGQRSGDGSSSIDVLEGLHLLVYGLSWVVQGRVFMGNVVAHGLSRSPKARTQMLR